VPTVKASHVGGFLLALTTQFLDKPGPFDFRGRPHDSLIVGVPGTAEGEVPSFLIGELCGASRRSPSMLKHAQEEVYPCHPHGSTPTPTSASDVSSMM